jgi:hypothetical protein
MGFSTKASAQTDYWSYYTGATFTNGTSSSTLINNTSNWTAPSTTIPDPGSVCPGGTSLCGMKITVPAGQSLPTFSNILSALKTYYDSNKPFIAGSSFTLTVSSISLTVTVYLQP